MDHQRQAYPLSNWAAVVLTAAVIVFGGAGILGGFPNAHAIPADWLMSAAVMAIAVASVTAICLTTLCGNHAFVAFEDRRSDGSRNLPLLWLSLACLLGFAFVSKLSIDFGLKMLSGQPIDVASVNSTALMVASAFAALSKPAIGAVIQGRLEIDKRAAAADDDSARKAALEHSKVIEGGLTTRAAIKALTAGGSGTGNAAAAAAALAMLLGVGGSAPAIEPQAAPPTEDTTEAAPTPKNQQSAALTGLALLQALDASGAMRGLSVPTEGQRA